MIWLAIEAPFAACRPMMAGWHRPTAGFLTHSAAYGLVLNVAGVESRLGEHEPGHPGGVPATVTAPACRRSGSPSGSPRAPTSRASGRVFQQLHNYSVAAGNAGIKPEFALGRKNNIAPVRREFLSDLRAVVVRPGRRRLRRGHPPRPARRTQRPPLRPALPRRQQLHARPPRGGRAEARPAGSPWPTPAGGSAPGRDDAADRLVDRLTPSARDRPCSPRPRTPPSTPPESALVPVGDPAAFDRWAGEQRSADARSNMPLVTRSLDDRMTGGTTCPPSPARRSRDVTRPAPAGDVPPRPGLLPAPLLPGRSRGDPRRRRPRLRRPRAARLARRRRGRRADPARTGRPGARPGRQGRRLRRRDGSLIPYEHKRGKARRDGKVARGLAVRPPPGRRLRRPDRVGHRPAHPRGPRPLPRRQRHRPRPDRRRRPAPTWPRPSPTARRLRESTERPPVADNERLCVRCSLAPVCLPEEVRQADDPEPRARPGSSRPTATAPASTSSPPAPASAAPARPSSSRPPDGEPPTKHADPRDRLAPAPRPRPGHDPGPGPLRRARRPGPLAHDLRAITPPASPPPPARSSGGSASTGPWPTRRPASAWPGRWPTPRSRASTATCSGARAATTRPATRCSPTSSRSARPWRRSTRAADRDSLRGLEGSAAVGYFRGLARLLAPVGPRVAPLHDPQPPPAAGPLQRPARLRLRPAPHGRHAGDPGRRAWSRRWASSTPRAAPPTRWCST